MGRGGRCKGNGDQFRRIRSDGDRIYAAVPKDTAALQAQGLLEKPQTDSQEHWIPDKGRLIITACGSCSIMFDNHGQLYIYQIFGRERSCSVQRGMLLHSNGVHAG